MVYQQHYYITIRGMIILHVMLQSDKLWSASAQLQNNFQNRVNLSVICIWTSKPLFWKIVSLCQFMPEITPRILTYKTCDIFVISYWNLYSVILAWCSQEREQYITNTTISLKQRWATCSKFRWHAKRIFSVIYNNKILSKYIYHNLRLLIYQYWMYMSYINTSLYK